MLYDLKVDDKLYCSDKGFGEKYGTVLKVNEFHSEAVIKWDEFEKPFNYAETDLRTLFEQGDCRKVTQC